MSRNANDSNANALCDKKTLAEEDKTFFSKNFDGKTLTECRP